MTELKALLEAWAQGGDCWFAVMDALRDLGYSNAAAFHEKLHSNPHASVYSNRHHCSLVIHARGRNPFYPPFEDWLREHNERHKDEA